MRIWKLYGELSRRRKSLSIVTYQTYGKLDVIFCFFLVIFIRKTKMQKINICIGMCKSIFSSDTCGFVKFFLLSSFHLKAFIGFKPLTEESHKHDSHVDKSLFKGHALKRGIFGMQKGTARISKSFTCRWSYGEVSVSLIVSLSKHDGPTLTVTTSRSYNVASATS